MFTQARLARLEIDRIFESVSYDPSPNVRRGIAIGIKRDLQAKTLRPNVKVPSRRNLAAYLRTMYRETGSLRQTFASVLHPGSWTSSGGSFRLAEMVHFDLPSHCMRIARNQGSLSMIEVGAGWAGFHPAKADDMIRDIAGLSNYFASERGIDVSLHFTNLTQWHDPSELPDNVIEHPYVTAASLSYLGQTCIAPGSVDVIYSQAAAYFEEDQEAFLSAAANLLKPEGMLFYNHRSDLSDGISIIARNQQLSLEERIAVGGMNGDVSRFKRRFPARAVYTPRLDKQPVALAV